MKPPNRRRWIWLIVPISTLIIFTGILLASETQDAPQLQDAATAVPEEEAVEEATPAATITATAEMTPTAPTTIDYAMYFQSQV